MEATITHDWLDDGEEVGRKFMYGDPTNTETPKVRKLQAYDDDGELYYQLDCEMVGEIDLGDLLMQLGAYSGVTRLKDVTGDSEDWSAE